ncbi:MAG TPA: helicase-associated domain-containing protein [Isosphaeraceae bacterium]|jgi:hypothetical protein|nr:helicase-associated domain-containing protein [Isosphaeraceae bacterium]
MIDPSTTAAASGSEPNPFEVYRRALTDQGASSLRQILSALGRIPRNQKPRELADEIAERLGEPGVVEDLLGGLSEASRMALALFALTETRAWLAVGLAHCLGCLGIDEPIRAVRSLLDLGLLTVGPRIDGQPLRADERIFGLEASPDIMVQVVVHPAAVAAARTVRPTGARLPSTCSVRQVREADGLEPILRIAALWQGVAEAPLRQTQQGLIYKRDRDRLEDDPVLAGPIADALEPVPDMVPLWLALARGVGLIAQEPGTDRSVAAPASYWAENAVHLPQMVASRWLVIRSWNETLGAVVETDPVSFSLVFTRPAVLLWLATLGADEWVALDDLAGHLENLWPGWDFGVRAGRMPELRVEIAKPARGKGAAPLPRPYDAGGLEAMLLGPAYQLGLIRAGEEIPSGRRVVQLTALGRYVLALGSPPKPRPEFEHFLFVQPNFEVIAYREGLNPPLIGQFSRFARWSQIGAALELKLAPAAIYRGLEGGLSPDDMLARLARHSARPLPPGVAEAVRTWAERRDRITYYAAATLIEFATAEALERALAIWPATGRVEPVRVSDRLLLVEDGTTIPFQRFRLTGSRDYRRPPEACLDVESDGVTLALDLGRSDLLVDAELARVADELAPDHASAGLSGSQRRFLVSAASLARATSLGMTPTTLHRWYELRTGTGMPPAVSLMLHSASPRVRPLPLARHLVLSAPSAELLDGLVQHPATRDYLGERLGPTTIVVPDPSIAPLQAALASLGLSLDDRSGSSTSRGTTVRLSNQ